MTDLMCSICCITYNHESVIQQAVHSFIAQKTDFEFDIVISDDGSTDSTVIKLDKLIQNETPKLLVTRNQRSSGAIENFVHCLQNCHGKYIAICDGDDYWTDPYKLQKQVDYLEQHPDCAICYHRVHTLQDGQLLPETLNTATTAANYTLDDLLPGNKMHTVSVVFRNTFSTGIPAWISRCPIGDYPLHCYNAQQGYIHYMPDIMAVYRLHSASYYSHLPQYHKYVKIIQTLEIMRRHLSLSTGQHKVIASRSQMYIHYLLNALWQQKMYSNAIRLLGRYSLLYPGTCLRWAATRLRHPLAHA